MGSTIRFNDTLQITAEQGFPAQLDIIRHLQSPLQVSAFKDLVFSFHAKEGIRNFQQPPVQNFLVENRSGKHIYWGPITILNVQHNYVANMTSGHYKLHMLYNIEQMKMAAKITGLSPELDFFTSQ